MRIKPLARATLLQGRGLLEDQQGQLEQAVASLRDAVEIVRHYGDRRTIATFTTTYARLLADAGENEEARRLLHQVSEEAEALGLGPQVRRPIGMVLGAIEMTEGEFDLARVNLRGAFEVSQQAADARGALLPQLVEVEVLLREGEWAQSEQRLADLDREAAQLGFVEFDEYFSIALLRNDGWLDADAPTGSAFSSTEWAARVARACSRPPSAPLRRLEWLGCAFAFALAARAIGRSAGAPRASPKRSARRRRIRDAHPGPVDGAMAAPRTRPADRPQRHAVAHPGLGRSRIAGRAGGVPVVGGPCVAGPSLVGGGRTARRAVPPPAAARAGGEVA